MSFAPAQYQQGSLPPLDLNDNPQNTSASLNPGQLPPITQGIDNAVSGYLKSVDQSPLGALNPFHFQPQQFLPRIQAMQARGDSEAGILPTDTLQQKLNKSTNYMSTPQGFSNMMPMVMGSVGDVAPVNEEEDVAGQAANTSSAPLAQSQDYTGVNTWSPYIKTPGEQGSGVMENPNYRVGSESPTQYAQDATNADAFARQQGNNPPPPPPQIPQPVTKAQIPSQPELTPQQIKNFRQSGLDRYQLPASFGDRRATLEGIDKSVMANVIGGKSPEEIMQNIPAAEQKVWGQVSDKASSIPEVNIEQDIVPHINSHLEDLVHQGVINDAEYQQVSKNIASNIYAKATDPLAPEKTITGQDLIDLQTGANAKAPKTIPTGSNSIPYINKAVADGYRDAIGNVDPNIRYLYNQYSSIKRIGNMSNTFRDTAGMPPSLWQRLRQNPAATIGSLGLAGLAGQTIAGDVGSKLGSIGNALATGGEVAHNLIGNGLNSLENSLGYVPKNNPQGSQDNSPSAQIGESAGNQNNQNSPNPKMIVSHGNSISQGVNTHMLPQDIRDATGMPVTIDEYNQAVNAPGYSSTSNAAQTLEHNMAVTRDVSAQNMPGNIPKFMGSAPQATTVMNSLNNTDLKTLSQIYQKLPAEQDYESYVSTPTNPFAAQIKALHTLNDYYKTAYGDVLNGQTPNAKDLINPGDSPEQIKEKLGAQKDWINQTYTQYQPYWDAINPTPKTLTQNSPSVQTSSGSDLPPISAPQAASLPPIPAGFHMTQ